MNVLASFFSTKRRTALGSLKSTVFLKVPLSASVPTQKSSLSHMMERPVSYFWS